jgi:hypothetical protein
VINLDLDLLTLHRQPAPHPDRLTRANRPGREGARGITDDTEDILALEADVLDVFGKVGGVDDEAVG